MPLKVMQRGTAVKVGMLRSAFRATQSVANKASRDEAEYAEEYKSKAPADRAEPDGCSLVVSLTASTGHPPERSLEV